MAHASPLASGINPWGDRLRDRTKVSPPKWSRWELALAITLVAASLVWMLSGCSMFDAATSPDPLVAAPARQQLDTIATSAGGAIGTALGGPVGGASGAATAHYLIADALALWAIWRRVTEAKRHAKYSSASATSEERPAEA